MVTANTTENVKPTATEEMKAKIAALLAKANGTDNVNEAEAFFAGAAKLMAKYQLQHWELRDAEDPMGSTTAWATNKNPVTWKKVLATTVAAYFGCTSVMHATNTGVRFEFVGRQSARVTALEMYPFIIAQCKAAGAAIFAKDGDLNAKRHTRKVAHALSMRLMALVAANMAAEVEAGGKTGKMALVKVDELAAYLATLGTVNGRASKVGTGGKRHADAANAVAIDVPVTGNSAATKAIAS